MNQRGFTLIEMIVSIAIFMVVAVVAVGSLVRIVALNRQAQALQSSVNNISFSLDSMSRELRQSAKIACQPSYNGAQINDPSTITSDCENMHAGQNQLIVFQTNKTAPKSGGGTCNLYYAYWFSPIAGTSPVNYSIQKAQQTGCDPPGQSLTGGPSSNFYTIIDDANVKITGYNLAVFSALTNSLFTYKWVFVRVTGYSGVKAADQNYFDVQTSVSQRVND